MKVLIIRGYQANEEDDNFQVYDLATVYVRKGQIIVESMPERDAIEFARLIDEAVAKDLVYEQRCIERELPDGRIQQEYQTRSLSVSSPKFLGGLQTYFTYRDVTVGGYVVSGPKSEVVKRKKA